MIIIQSTINVLCAIAVYLLVVKNRGSTFSYIVGYGIIFPILVNIPFKVARLLGVLNMSMLVGMTGAMSIVIFRCMMGKYGTAVPVETVCFGRL